MPSPNWNSVKAHTRVDHELQHKGMRLFLGIQTTLKPSQAPNAFEFALPNIELSCGAASDLPYTVLWNCLGLKLNAAPLTTPAIC
jgi:hypothetical protein